MGMQFFTQSGTFNPSDWGLTVGDTLQLVIVGGGQGGCNAGGTVGAVGSDSSFGSIVAKGGVGGSAPAYPFMQPGGKFNYQTSKSTSIVYNVYVSYGGAGWLPGRGQLFNDATSSIPLQYVSKTFQTSSTGYSTLFFLLAGTQKVDLFQSNFADFTGTQAAATLPRSNCGSIDAYSSSSNGYYYGLSSTTLGYGAGGGGGMFANSSGAYYGTGGASGQVIYAALRLTASSSIAVTVGAGGLGAATDGSYLMGGGGAQGCVAVFW